MGYHFNLVLLTELDFAPKNRKLQCFGDPRNFWDFGNSKIPKYQNALDWAVFA
jgi:hypothetical protein